LSADPFIPSNQKIKQGAQEGQENDDKHPHYLIIPSKIIHQNTNQGKEGQKYNKKDDKKCQNYTGTK